MQLCLQFTETSSFCLFNLLIGLVRCFAEFLKGSIDKGLIKLRQKKRAAKALAKIALEILHIFLRNFRPKQPKFQNRPKFAPHVELLFKSQHQSK